MCPGINTPCFNIMSNLPLGEGTLYAAQAVYGSLHSFSAGGAASWLPGTTFYPTALDTHKNENSYIMNLPHSMGDL